MPIERTIDCSNHLQPRYPGNAPAIALRYPRAQRDTRTTYSIGFICIMLVQTLLRAHVCCHLRKPLWPPRRVREWECQDWCLTDAARPVWPSYFCQQNVSGTGTLHLWFAGCNGWHSARVTNWIQRANDKLFGRATNQFS